MSRAKQKTTTTRAAPVSADRPDVGDLEGPICDLAIMATIAADLVEHAAAASLVEGETAEKILFAVYRLQSMTADLRRDYYAAIYERAEQSPAWFRDAQERMAAAVSRATATIERGTTS